MKVTQPLSLLQVNGVLQCHTLIQASETKDRIVKAEQASGENEGKLLIEQRKQRTWGSEQLQPHSLWYTWNFLAGVTGPQVKPQTPQE